MLNLEDFWREFDEDPKKAVGENLEVKLDNHPYICIGAFYKTVLEGGNLSNFIITLMSQEGDREKVMGAAQEYLYEKAFQNLLHLDFSSEYHVEQIQKHPKDKIIKAINVLLPKFEEKEEYEKCALLKKLEGIL